MIWNIERVIFMPDESINIYTMVSALAVVYYIAKKQQEYYGGRQKLKSIHFLSIVAGRNWICSCWTCDKWDEETADAVVSEQYSALKKDWKRSSSTSSLWFILI